MDKTKPFGLILTKKVKKFDSKRKSVFNSSSDEEIAEKGKYPKITLPSSSSKIRVKVESAENPEIYEYDKIYDEMKAGKEMKVAEKKKQDSRYIDSLLKAATKRKKEHERRVEKKIHVEREKEGNKFQDKEEFVTSAYKKKMQEMEEEEKRESHENQLNELMDVTKQKDLSGFYRHFLKQTVGEEKIPVFGDRQAIKVEKDLNEDVPKENVSDKSNNLEKESETGKIKFHSRKVRSQFRGTETKRPEEPAARSRSMPIRKSDELVKTYDDEDRDADSNSSNNDEDRDADSNSSNDDSSDPESTIPETKHRDGIDKKSVEIDEDSLESNKPLDKVPQKAAEQVKTFEDIFAKRTVRVLFDQAQARYFARRAAQKAM